MLATVSHMYIPSSNLSRTIKAPLKRLGMEGRYFMTNMEVHFCRNVLTLHAVRSRHLALVAVDEGYPADSD